MALSGSFYTNVGSHWRLQLEWSATQNISTNQSTVVAKLYWIAIDGYGAVYSSQTNPCSVYIDGTWSEGSASPALSGNQKKLVRQYSRIITHASDGKATIDLDGWFDIQVTLGGTYYGRVNLPTKSYTLDTIPRASSLSSSASWTAGNDLAISITRASSSFVHSVYVYVNGVLIGYKGNVGSSTTFAFSTSENTEIFNQLNTSSTQDTKIKVVTYPYAGGSSIGEKEYTGTVTAPYSSDVGDTFDAYRYTDEDVVVPINRRNSEFTHTVTFTLGSFSKSITGATTSATFSFNSTEEAQINAQMPSSVYRDGTITIRTFYNGEQVRSDYSRSIQMHVRNANPTFSASNISYADTRSATVTITGNNQVLIQDQSDLTAYVNTGATALKGASIIQYVITIGSAQEILTTTGSKLIGRISASTNQTLSIKAVDSRGNSTTVSKTVTIVPWQEPKLTLKLDRLNKFEDTTTINISGSFSPVTISGANKNLVQLVRYRYKVKGAGTWTLDWTTLTHTTNGTSFSVAGFNRTLDNTKSWEFEFSVQDKFTTNVDLATVGTGSPIIFIDSTKKSVGVGKFPSKSGTLETLGNIHISGKVVEGDQGKLIFDSDVAQGVQIRFNSFDSTKAPMGLHIESTPENTNSTQPYLKVDGVIEAGSHMVLTGNSQLQFSTHGGGFYMQDSTWIRTTGSKSIYSSTGIIRSDGALQVGNLGANFNANSSEMYTGVRMRNDYSGEALKFETTASTTSFIRWTRAGSNIGYIGLPSTSTTDFTLYSYSGLIALNGGKIDSSGGTMRWQRSDSHYIAHLSDGRVFFYMNGAVKHSFNTDGTKSGGSIEVDGINLGMSPIDSPQILLEYVEFGIPLTLEGLKIYVDPMYLKTVAHFDVFPSRGEIVEVGEDYFVIKGDGGSASCRIVGERIGYDGVFYDDMDSKNEDINPQSEVLDNG